MSHCVVVLGTKQPSDLIIHLVACNLVKFGPPNFYLTVQCHNWHTLPISVASSSVLIPATSKAIGCCQVARHQLQKFAGGMFWL